MRPPAFWQRDGVLPRLLSPAGAVVAAATARRMTRPGWRSPVPVLCCGNAGVGGAGKTTVVLDLAARLRARGLPVHALSRGYGGVLRGPVLVDPAVHRAALVGDEPLLLAMVLPTWVGADRVRTARAAIGAGAGALLMDDGLQNPGLAKSLSLLVVDGAVGFGNGRVLPAGPLREAPERAAARCRAAIMIGADATDAARRLGGLPVLAASLVPDRRLEGRVFAVSGIARPGKFHDTLREAGAEVVGAAEFADHHRFTEAEIARVLADARALGARPITTAKDAARLPVAIEVLGVRLRWADEPALDHLLAEAVP